MFLPVKDTFLYFAYGSNLLKKRIHINNPTAGFVGIGRLNDHSLDFSRYSGGWGGAVATIVPTDGAYVWGAVWRLQNHNLAALDRQEGVESKTYFPRYVNIQTVDNSTILCRTYQLTENPLARKSNEDLPADRRPSITYLEVIVQGAMECHLPEDYMDKLKKIPHNGRMASPEMIDKLRN